MNEIKSTSDLREMLIESIEEVKTGKLDVKKAKAITAISTVILTSAKLDLQVMQYRQIEKKGSAKIDDTPLQLVHKKEEK